MKTNRRYRRLKRSKIEALATFDGDGLHDQWSYVCPFFGVYIRVVDTSDASLESLYRKCESLFCNETNLNLEQLLEANYGSNESLDGMAMGHYGLATKQAS